MYQCWWCGAIVIVKLCIISTPCIQVRAETPRMLCLFKVAQYFTPAVDYFKQLPYHTTKLVLVIIM